MKTVLPELPPKHYLKAGNDPRVVAERTPVLQEVLDVIWLEPEISRAHPAVRAFLDAGNETRAR